MILLNLNDYVESFPALAKDYPKLIDRFKVLMMAVAYEKTGTNEAFKEVFFDQKEDGTWVEKYRRPGESGIYDDGDDVYFLNGLVDGSGAHSFENTLRSWAGNEGTCPGFSNDINAWTEFTLYLNSFGLEGFFSGFDLSSIDLTGLLPNLEYFTG